MAARKRNITIECGSTFEWDWSWGTGTKTDFQPYDLTGCSARMQIRQSVDSPDVLVDLTTDNGGIVLGGVLGTGSVRILPAATAPLAGLRSGVYDLEVYFPSGRERRLWEGTAVFSRPVTRNE